MTDNDKSKISLCQVCKYNEDNNVGTFYNICYNCVGYYSAFEPSNALQMALNNKRDIPLLILGFPGIGKTYLKEQYKGTRIRVVDSDSSEFNKSEFPQNYIDHINKLVNEGVNVILISTHEVVRRAIRNSDLMNKCQVVVVHPELNAKEYYIKRYKERGNNDKFIKLISDNWEKWITDIQNEDWCYRIELWARERNGKIEFDNLSNHTYKFLQFEDIRFENAQ